MARRIRIPLLIDLVTLGHGDAIRAVRAAPSLDRRYLPAGPLLNRLVVRRLRRVLSTGTCPLPSALPRYNAERASAHEALGRRLDADPEALLDADTIAALATFVRGDGGSVGPLSQQAIGRLFRTDYEATAETWDAAVILQAGLRNNNPIRRLAWFLTGRIRRAQRTLSAASDDDPAAVHATGIAVHNLVTAMERLRALYRSPWGPAGVSAEEAVARALAAPVRVIRQSEGHDDSVIGALRPGTLVAFNLREAGERTPAPEITFMAGSWSECPAHRVVPAMVSAIWTRAAGA